MNHLLKHAIAAHGGMERWNKFSVLTAHLSQGGILWPLKQQGGVLDDVDIAIKLHQPWTSHHPFGTPARRTSVAPGRVAIEEKVGSVVAETLAPRASFAGHRLDTPWTDLQLAYFAGYAIWNYFTMPFTLARPGFSLVELTPWHEAGQTWRRLQATFPADLDTHCPVQTFYFSADGLLRRHDYEVDISGSAPAVHYMSGHVSVQGITVPATHRIHVRDEDGGHQDQPLVVSIDVTQIAFIA